MWAFVTKPISHSIAFSRKEIKYALVLTIGGDSVDLINILGVIPGNCISCEFPIPNPSIDRRNVDSSQPFQSFNELTKPIKSNNYTKRNDTSSKIWSSKLEMEKKTLKGKKKTYRFTKKCHILSRTNAQQVF